MNISRYLGKYTDPNNETDKERAKRYFSQLTQDQLEKLYEKYYWDFKIFGYSPAYVGHPELDDGIT